MSSPKKGYEAWLEEGCPTSHEALLWVRRQITRQTKLSTEDGVGRLRPSHVGHECDRMKQLSFIGAEQNPGNNAFAVNGTWSHLRWGVAGLTMGFLERAEKKIMVNRLLRGTCDGITDDGRLFELKTIHSQVLYKMEEPKQEHKDQMFIYMYGLRKKEGVIVYEGRDSQQIKEWDIRLDYNRVTFLLERSKILLRHMKESSELIPMHDACTPKSNMRTYCDFSRICLEKWAEEALGQEEHLMTEADFA